MVLKPTKQQQEVIDAFHTGKDVTISAGAGCGKSSTLEMVSRSTKDRGLLIAFNRSVADEAARKLQGTTTKALNTHRIAYAWARNDEDGQVVLSKMQGSNRVRRDQIARSFGARNFSYKSGDHETSLRPTAVVDAAMGTLDSFMKDGTPEITDTHVPYMKGLEPSGVKGKKEGHKALASVAVPLARKMWKDILNPNSNNMRVTHDAYLKLWASSNPVLPYDFILLDEAQDTNPAVFSVFDSQEAQKISVGDACQQLFAWNGSVNIMEKFHAELNVKLTQSWRFGIPIQDAANVFLDKLNADIRLEGNPRVNSLIVPGAAFDPHKSSATLVRTNAGAIMELISALDAGQDTYLIGGNRSFVSLIESAEKLKQGRTVTHPDFVAFKTWPEVQAYANDDPDGLDLKVIVNLVDTHGTRALLKALNSCVDNEAQAQTVISTVHKVKGREWDQVRLADDFERAFKNKKKSEEESISKEDLMLYYVAVTRAKEVLDPGALEQFMPKVHLPGAQANIGNSVFLSLDQDLQKRLSAKFSTREEVEAYAMKVLLDSLD